MADTFRTQLDVGTTSSVLDIRTGAQPADPDTAATGTLLATLTFSDPVAGAATDGAPGGLLTFSAITQDSSADNTGTAGYFRCRATGTGADDICDGECGTSGADLNLNTTAITALSAVSITSMTVTQRET